MYRRMIHPRVVLKVEAAGSHSIDIVLRFLLFLGQFLDSWWHAALM